MIGVLGGGPEEWDKLQPLGDRVLLQAMEAVKETVGGVILASDEVERPTLGKVRANGEEKRDGDGRGGGSPARRRKNTQKKQRKRSDDDSRELLYLSDGRGRPGVAVLSNAAPPPASQLTTMTIQLAPFLERLASDLYHSCCFCCLHRSCV